ncbi:NUDIX domain-containing protein [Bacillus sp. KH172YL63]|uniref:NUDIX domain-containing protein n=1 Tax=Bacillus sp. KH172YL63 TaxID=2709784 RepID=UPI001E41B722|nr:NUDIX hydrolase [Bacillus sp. KH172YL63]
MDHYGPIAGSFSFVFQNEKVLLCYHSLRQQWELPAGKRENQETALACAIRELYEETGQKVDHLEFKGLMKIKRSSGEIQFNPVFSTEITALQPFVENDETSRIMLWDGKEEIGIVDSIDEKLIQIFLRGTR